MEAEEYFSKDFEWEELKREVLSDPSLQHHLMPFEPSSSSSLVVLHEEESNAWRKFHSRHHTGKFFKERRYLLKEFPELVSCGKDSLILEVGCGNGSTALPILRNNENIDLYACDCSPEALEYAKEMIDAANVASAMHRFHPFLCDLSLTGFPEWLFCVACQKTSLSQSLPSDVNIVAGTLTGDRHSKENSCCLGGLDFVTLIFTLSAIPFQMMSSALVKCFSVLKPGGLVLFRDYGLFDMTMLRFEPGKRVGFLEYMRSDGTRSYFFSLETVRDLFIQAGFIEVELDYCCIKSVNRKKGKSMQRVWVHGKFQKPPHI
ncbi:hypothetical protein SAY87_007154 [Trapa incisa]|uniref:tRNA N(3)-methylcytidine methyltransferase n=1 Tax=Trapa incisa TaxID=236973 RepID=A0AAN7K2D6_9MYRT|nr:hypothetical protein SAY87_007154 [Trapa incisa]